MQAKNNNLPYRINNHTIISFTLWHIWLVRNDTNFNNTQHKLSINFVTNQALEFTYMATNFKLKQKQILKPIKWIPPKPTFFKFNTDGTVSYKMDPSKTN